MPPDDGTDSKNKKTPGQATDKAKAALTQAGTQAGDIRGEAPVSWSADTTLTLSAIGHIEINADLDSDTFRQS